MCVVAQWEYFEEFETFVTILCYKPHYFPDEPRKWYSLAFPDPEHRDDQNSYPHDDAGNDDLATRKWVNVKEQKHTPGVGYPGAGRVGGWYVSVPRDFHVSGASRGFGAPIAATERNRKRRRSGGAATGLSLAFATISDGGVRGSTTRRPDKLPVSS